MKKILFNLFVINILLFVYNISYSNDDFSLYGVSIGESYDDVKQNGVDRGYNIIETNHFDDNYISNITKIFLGSNVDKNINAIPQEYYSKYLHVRYEYFKENIFMLRYESKEKLVNLDIYFIKDFNQLNVFMIIANDNISSIIDTFNKKYGNYKIKEYKENGWGGDRKYYIWDNGDINASVEDNSSPFILVDTSQINEIFGTIYNDYMNEIKEEKVKQIELKKKRDGEI